MQIDSNAELFKVLSSDKHLYGPIDIDTLLQWVRERRIQRETWIHSETANNWFAAGSLDTLQSAFDALDTELDETQAAPRATDVIAVEELREFERFEPYSNEELSLLLNFCELVIVAKGEMIIKKGDMSDSMFLILSGQVRARLKVGGLDTSLGTMDPGELFGEVAMLSQTSRSADVVAEVPTRLLQLTSGRFQELISDHPALAAKILYNLSRMMATRLSERNAQLQKDLSSSFAWR